MSDIWEDEAARQRDEAAREDADSELQTRKEAKRAAEFAKGVRLGFHDAEGEPIGASEDDDDETEDDDD